MTDSIKKHTQEPWEAFTACPGQCCWNIREKDTEGIWHGGIAHPEFSEADAKRAATCVNACKGIESGELEAVNYLEVLTTLKEARQVLSNSILPSYGYLTGEKIDALLTKLKAA